MYSLVLEIEDKLKAIPLTSLDIGVEEGISANDTPFVRIEPVSNEKVEHEKQVLEFDLFVGTDIKDNLRDTYQEHMEIIEEIKSVLHIKYIGNGVCYFKRALYDRDIVKNFKVSKLEFEVRNITDN